MANGLGFVTGDMVHQTINFNGKDGRPSNSRVFPGFLGSDPYEIDVTTKSGEVVKSVRCAQMVTFRTPRDGGDPVIRISDEQLQFGRYINTVRRNRPVVGFEVTEDGELLDQGDIMLKALEQAAEFVDKIRAAQAPQTVTSADDI